MRTEIQKFVTMSLVLGLLGLSLLLVGRSLSDETPFSGILFSENFEKQELGSVPETILVVDGGFVVKGGEKGKFFELPGSPLETYSAQFGENRKDSVEVKADIFGTSKGRRFPVVGVGLGGLGGYRIQAVPGKRILELRKGDNVLTNVPLAWVSGVWTQFKLSIVPHQTAGKWLVEGSIRTLGSDSKVLANVSWEVSESPASGKASIWGVPYAETPILYDHLEVRVVPVPK